jgi:hypothetical protein
VKAPFFATVISLALALAAVNASAQEVGPFQCIAASVAGGHVTMYVSQLIPSGGARPSAAINSAWGDYVKATYHLDAVSSAVCHPLPADPSMQQRVIATEQNAWQKNNIQLVQVNYAPGQKQNSSQNANTNPYTTAAPPADAPAGNAPAAHTPASDAQNAPPPADQGPPPRASYCYSDDKKPTIYFSDAFDTAELPSAKAWSAAFGKMLAQKYMYKGIVTCKDSDTIFNAQGAIRDQKDALAAKQFIDTDWMYESPAPGDATASDADTSPPPPPKKKTAKPPAQN